MANPVLIADLGISGLALLTIIPVAVIIWLDLKMVNWGLKRGGKTQYLGIIASFILGIGLFVGGCLGIFNDFSLVYVFLTFGAGLIILFTIRLATFINEEDRVKNKYLK
jgi:O-antigen/teichoic acid export membrane protein